MGCFGTMLLGRWDAKSDGSFKTTKWLIIGAPFVPIEVYRIQETRGQTQVLDVLPVDWRAARRQYGLTILVFVALFALGLLLNSVGIKP